MTAAGLDVAECAQLLCDTFAEMIFVHGRVHADPHAGNIYFKVIEIDGEKHPQLVMLDHGLYYDLCEGDHNVRLNFCRYWKARLYLKYILRSILFSSNINRVLSCACARRLVVPKIPGRCKSWGSASLDLCIAFCP